MAIIKPCIKNSLAEPCLPLEYTGITLLATVYKLFTPLLNNTLTHVAESYNLYVDEQNVLRKDMPCIDSLCSLTSIIRNRKTEGKQTYVDFVDFKHSFH